MPSICFGIHISRQMVCKFFFSSCVFHNFKCLRNYNTSAKTPASLQPLSLHAISASQSSPDHWHAQVQPLSNIILLYLLLQDLIFPTIIPSSLFPFTIKPTLIQSPPVYSTLLFCPTCGNNKKHKGSRK